VSEQFDAVVTSCRAARPDRPLLQGKSPPYRRFDPASAFDNFLQTSARLPTSAAGSGWREENHRCPP
jgi:hypothetical protein